MAIVRISLDLEVGGKTADDVKDRIFEDRELILNFIRATVVPEIDSKVGDTKALGGNTHVHDVGERTCSACYRYAERPVLTPLK